jgi:hypothetical protein
VPCTNLLFKHKMSTFSEELSPLFRLADENLETPALKSAQDMFRIAEYNILSALADLVTQEDGYSTYHESKYYNAKDNLKDAKYSFASNNKLLKLQERLEAAKQEYEESMVSYKKTRDLFVNLCCYFDVEPGSYDSSLGPISCDPKYSRANKFVCCSCEYIFPMEEDAFEGRFFGSHSCKECHQVFLASTGMNQTAWEL